MKPATSTDQYAATLGNFVQMVPGVRENPHRDHCKRFKIGAALAPLAVAGGVQGAEIGLAPGFGGAAYCG